ncbi:cyclin-dependent kinase regulatory subunit [Tricholoma matsutake]|nr:cyclin-dependent kinase regulatory subunit [Tricholoma matsutake 945]
MATKATKAATAKDAILKLEECILKIKYSDRYSDDDYEYRHVTVPKQLLEMVPKNFFNDKTGTLRLLAEPEWRGIGIAQSLGWEHYEVHAPEPHVLLFRRPKGFVAPPQHSANTRYNKEGPRRK